MTEFKITPEDVGRVAVIERNATEWRCVYVNDYWACFELAPKRPSVDRESHMLHTVDLYGMAETGYDINHWKPRTLVAPKRWWVVSKTKAPHFTPNMIVADYYTHFRDAAKCEETDLATPIARIYAEHWHGCEEGRFDTPESIEGEES